MRRKEGKGGNYFWIKGPVDLFLFSASPLNLQLLHSASLSSFLSICIVLKALLVLHSLVARLSLWYTILFCPRVFSVQSHLTSLYLSFVH